MNFRLITAAKKLGADTAIMDSYWKYHEREQNWFFSPNPNLDGATRKPISFPAKKDWNKLSLRQRMTLNCLAGFSYEGREVNPDNGSHFSRLRAGYEQWRHDLYSVFWSDGGEGKSWLCNVFVGDAIYLYNGKSFTSGNNHYYDPRQIASGKSFLHKRSSYKEVEAGDIVVFGTHHVEIITAIRKYWMADDGFCSIGAGRASNPIEKKGDGKERCDTAYGFSLSGDTRELGDENNSYFYFL
jgi:hypothetical protein